MSDPFLALRREPRRKPAPKAALTSSSGHGERAHSMFSASGAERWFACPGSVTLQEGMPDKPNVYTLEGTKGHEVLEAMMLTILAQKAGLPVPNEWLKTVAEAPPEMFTYAKHAARFILGLADKLPGSEVLVETRIYLDFIHPQMFGTFDGAVVDHFGTLHVFDYKYGQGHAVSVKENLQMIFYGIGLAHRYHWNFKSVRLWVIQPRIAGYDGPTFWEVPLATLQSYVGIFREKVERVLAVTGADEDYQEGQHCHWCKAKAICPLKRGKKFEDAKRLFTLAG